MSRLTWRRLIELEPRLLELERDIRAIPQPKPGETFCANARWYGHFGHSSLRARMSDLVGFDAPVRELRNREAYDLVYEHLYNLLPDCQNCICMSLLGLEDEAV